MFLVTYIRFFVFVIIASGIHGINEFNRHYQKNYYQNGILKSEGWQKNGIKSAYWKYYYVNTGLKEAGDYKAGKRNGYWHFYNDKGRLIKEGHFVKGAPMKWWLFYDQFGNINHKCQLRNGVKNGYCLKYNKDELISAQKYKDGKKINEWFDFSSFKRDNKLSDLK